MAFVDILHHVSEWIPLTTSSFETVWKFPSPPLRGYTFNSHNTALTCISLVRLHFRQVIWNVEASWNSQLRRKPGDHFPNFSLFFSFAHFLSGPYCSVIKGNKTFKIYLSSLYLTGTQTVFSLGPCLSPMANLTEQLDCWWDPGEIWDGVCV